MSELPASAPRLTLRLDSTGEVLETLTEWSMDEGYWEAADGFECKLVTNTLRPSRLWMQPVTLLLGDVPWMVGRVEVVSTDDSRVTMGLSGRDYLSELTEGHVDPSFKVTEKMSLADAILAAARPYGITSVISSGDFPLRKIRTGAVVASSAAVDFKSVKLDELQPKDGQSVFDFCNRLAARSGCTIQPDIRRNTLALAVPAYQSAPVAEIRRSLDRASSAGNVVKTARSTRDGTHWPSVLRVNGGNRAETVVSYSPKVAPDGTTADYVNADKESKLSLKRLGFTWDVAEGAAIFSPPLGAELKGKAWSGLRTAASPPLPTGQLYRLYRQQDDELRTEAQVMALGARILGERLKNTLVYRCTVEGFTDHATKRPWTIDTIVQVRDEIADIDEPMWVQSVSRRWSRSTGAETTLELIRPGVVRVGEDL